MTTLKHVQDDIKQQLMASEWFNFPKDSGVSEDLTHAVVGLGGESGEVLELLKKDLFRHKSKPVSEWISELGDVLWYLVAIASILGISMDDVWRYNCDKLTRRRIEGKNGKKWEG